jgi:tetratricopeptide (TPR) repeat protein
MATKKAKPSNKAAATPDTEERMDSAISRTENYLYNNGSKLLWIVLVVVLIVGGFMAYKYYCIPQRGEKAGEMMFMAEQNFAIDSFAVALNGDGNTVGFAEIAEKYSNTPQGNIAKHYAGICYLNLGDKDKALDYLSQYKETQGAPSTIINAQNYGLRGDLLVDKGEYDKAIDMYKKAVAAGDNALTAPRFLKKLGTVYAKLGRNKEAGDTFRQITDLYPSSMEARDAEKFAGASSQE